MCPYKNMKKCVHLYFIFINVAVHANLHILTNFTGPEINDYISLR